MVDVKTCLDNAQEKMDMAIMYLEEALAHIRAGKASTRLLDGIRVDSYGSMVPISNVAALSTPDARSITIKPWDKSMFRAIEKAIIICDNETLPAELFQLARRTGTPEAAASTLEQMEMQMIRKTLDKCSGNLSAVAAQLGITRQTLYNKMKKYGL